MAERELGILVRAKGAIEAATQIGKVDSSIGRLQATAARGVGNLTGNLARIGAVAGGVVISQVALGIQSLEQLETVTNQTNAVLESTGGIAGVTADQVRRLAENLEDVTTADDKAIQGGENLLLTFTGIGKDVFPQATKAMVDMAIAMAEGDVEAADFKSTALQVGKALNSPEEGLTALKKAGVSFTKQQQDQIKTLVKSGKTAEAQKIMLAELEREFGKAGEAAGKGFGADMRRFKDATESAQQALARGLIPVIKRVTSFLTEKLADPAVLAQISALGDGLADGFDDALTIAGNIPWATIGEGMKAAGAGAKAALEFFTDMPEWVQTAVVSGWGLNKLTGGALGSIIAQLGSGLIKGVLGMNAGVVNINAATVNGGGPGNLLGPAAAAAGGATLMGALSAGVFAVGAGIIGGLIAAEVARAINPGPSNLNGLSPSQKSNLVWNQQGRIGKPEVTVSALADTNHTLAEIGLSEQRHGERMTTAEERIVTLSRVHNDKLETLRTAISRISPKIVIVGSTTVTVSSRDAVASQTSYKILAGGIQQI